MFFENSVDLVLTGHIHIWQRSCPAAKGGCVAAGLQAPVHVATPSAGKGNGVGERGRSRELISSPPPSSRWLSSAHIYADLSRRRRREGGPENSESAHSRKELENDSLSSFCLSEAPLLSLLPLLLLDFSVQLAGISPALIGTALWWRRRRGGGCESREAQAEKVEKTYFFVLPQNSPKPFALFLPRKTGFKAPVALYETRPVWVANEGELDCF